jgi:hypothetical protein
MRRRFNLAMSSFWKAVKANFDLGDVVFLAAVAAVGYGVAQINQPAAWITVGVIFMIIASRKAPNG